MSIQDINFSLWADFIERDFLDGTFRELIKDGFVNGATSNPAIFKSSFLGSSAYKKPIEELKAKGLKPKEIYEALAIEDIKKAAQILRPLYDAGNDGFVSIEIDPFLAADIEASVDEGVRLFETIGEPNVMIKVPATDEGYAVMEELLKRDINVNATLIFSPYQAQKICEAILRADAKSAKCVISVFVSRFDRKLNDKLSDGLRNRVGVYNAAKIYSLVEASAPKNTKTLFASTGVKGSEVPTEYYIIGLIAKNSVNTAPIETIQAYKDSFHPKRTKLPLQKSEIDEFFGELAKCGVDIDTVYDELMNEGLTQFEVAFDDIMKALV
jgi:transaldolase